MLGHGSLELTPESGAVEFHLTTVEDADRTVAV